MAIRHFHRLARFIDIKHEVKNALEAKKPVVALESTIITHGMPYPQNKNTAIEVEEIIREQNAIPATIAIIDGRLKVGLSPEEINIIASSERTDVIKTSRRDLLYVLAKGLTGGTTVSGTMVAASHVGINVFVTGGIGGVHRGGEKTMDISTDLTELGKIGMAVVCSGIKSILDIGRSLEYLETQGVCVVTFGPTKDFPAFYCQKSDKKAPYNVTSAEEAAALIKVLNELQMQSSVLFAVPVPKECQLMDDYSMEKAIQNALKIASEEGIKGKEVTPFILQQLNEITGGHSLQTNIALVKNNALVGAKIAVALCKTLENEKRGRRKGHLNKNFLQKNLVYATPRAPKSNPVVVGGSILDSVVSVKEPFKVNGQTLACHINQSGGGVGRNIADALGKLNFSPTFVSAVGEDQNGKFLLEETINHLDHRGIMVSPDLSTASYICLLDEKGEVRIGAADMEIHNRISPDYISSYLQDTCAVIVDGNICSESIAFILQYCSKYGIPVIFEPTDAGKATIPFQYEAWKTLRLITPNIKELRRIASFIGLHIDTNEDHYSLNLEEIANMAFPLAEHIQTVMVTLGALGVMMVGRMEPEAPVTARYYVSTPLDNVLSVSGAGDCLAAAVISGILNGLEEPLCISAGFAAAHDSLHSLSAVPQQFFSTQKPVQYSLIESTVHRKVL